MSGKVVLVVLLGAPDESDDQLQETIRHELDSNPFWRKWKTDKITILDDATKQTIVEPA